LVKQYGEEVIGIIESNISLIVGDTLLPRLYELVEQHYQDLPLPLVSLPLPTVSVKTAVIVELTTKGMLIQEGRKQHHCVGGYGSAIKNGTSRIISIRDKDDTAVSTCELRLSNVKGVYQVKIAQHRAALNRNPCQRHIDIVRAYVDILNKQKPKRFF
jgi:hypothetical protein